MNDVRLLDGTDDGLDYYRDTAPVPDQLPPSREAFEIPRPSVLDVLRQCEPSRELIGLLSREATRMAEAGNLGDASALVALALCVREVVPR